MRFGGTENHERGLVREAANKDSRRAVCFVALFMALFTVLGLAQGTTLEQEDRVEGTVRDSSGKPVEGASVMLVEKEYANPVESKTNAEGFFTFLWVRPGNYTLKVQKESFLEASQDLLRLPTNETRHCDIILRNRDVPSLPSAPSTCSSRVGTIELDDRPTFTVSGITDTTGSGGHGSETRMRTGEALAKETMSLETDASTAVAAAAPDRGGTAREKQTETVLRAALVRSPRSFESNHELGELYLHTLRCHEAIPLLEAAYQTKPNDHANASDLALAFQACGEFSHAREQVNQMLVNENEFDRHDQGNLHNMLGDLDEKVEDPLGAVREYERAAQLDPSERNYFSWGTELLVHKAAAPAVEVFNRGARLHPDSPRMLAGLGAALYTSGSADDAAEKLCQASDLDPANPAPYLFLGRIQEAASAPLPCAEQKLARFAQEQPANALANYYYGLALWRRDRALNQSETLQLAEARLEQASALDPKLDVAYLQLGTLYFAREAVQQAVAADQKAIAANPAGGDAHYRLGLAYKRLGEEAKAEAEFERYRQLENTQAEKLEQQRQELKRFLFVLKERPTTPQSTSDRLPPSAPK